MVNKEDIREYNLKKEVESEDLLKKLKEENKKLKIENERLRLVVDSVPCIIHDINNFLTPIVGSVEIVKEEAKNQSRILNSLEIIESCANDGISISSNLMRHLKGIEAKEEDIISIDQTIDDVIEIVRKKYPFDKYKVNIQIDNESNAFIKANSTEIRELLINILNNSVDAIKENGNIRVSAKKQEGYVQIQISDNGIGMDEETKSKVFTPFFTTKGENGLGVGLHICEKMVKKYGGNISCKSKLNEGTTFNIMLPCCKKENCIKDTETQCDFHGKVLIVDDEKQLRDVISDMIKTVINCNVRAVSSTDILEIDDVNEYDVVISDYLMPKINGIELARLIKLKNPDVYFCLMTGWVGEFKDKTNENIDNILYKPINLKQIRELFHSVQEQKN